MIARLAAGLRCYEPERIDPDWARLRQLGTRRAKLITQATAQTLQVRDLIECVWPAGLDAAAHPFRAKSWCAAMTVVLNRCERDLSRVRRLGRTRFTNAVRRELPRWDATRPFLRIVDALFAALRDDRCPRGCPRQGRQRSLHPRAVEVQRHFERGHIVLPHWIATQSTARAGWSVFDRSEENHCRLTWTNAPSAASDPRSAATAGRRARLILSSGRPPRRSSRPSAVPANPRRQPRWHSAGQALVAGLVSKSVYPSSTVDAPARESGLDPYRPSRRFM